MPATLSRRAARGGGLPASDTPPAGVPAGAAAATATAAQRLRQHFAAARLSFTWFGVRKTLSAEQRAQAAERFGAQAPYLSAAKKLLDTSHPAFQAVNSVRSRAVSYWKGVSLPYPEPGVRLVRQDEVERFDRRMTALRRELADAVQALDAEFEQLKAAARQRLGRLFNPADYPPSLRGLFALEWEYPSVEPPEYLLRLNPQLFEQERRRIVGRFDEAVRMAEEAFTAEFARLVAHLTERLAGGPGGERKVFRDSAVTNLRAFFDRFRHLSVRSNEDLDRLVDAAQRTLDGVEPGAVRDSDSLRGHVSAQLASVQGRLDQMLVEQPRRRVLRGQSGLRPPGEG
jgi:hypothetical protein